MILGILTRLWRPIQVLQAANLRLMQAQQFKPPALQEENFVVQNQQATQVFTSS
jgi:hypothetical protein